MRKQQRFAFLAIGGLGLLAAIAPGLAAGIGTPPSVPAAGQGETVIEGFEISDIDWKINDDGEVIEVSFDIVRSVTGRSGVSANSGETTGNAVVRVRLEAGETLKAWTSCNVTTSGVEPNAKGEAVCQTTGAPQTLPASELTKVSFIAFDRTP